MTNYYVIIWSAYDANANAQNSLLSSPPVLSVARASNPVMQRASL